MSSVRILQKAQSVKVVSVSGLPYQPSEEIINEAVTEYMEAHPEAQIPDGSITEQKLSSALQAEIGEIEGIKEGTEVVGTADNLLSDSYTVSQEPYLLKPSLGARIEDTLVGGTVVWNQQLRGFNSWGASYSGDSVSVSSGIATITASRQYGGAKQGRNDDVISGHKYLVGFSIKPTTANTGFRLHPASLTGIGISVVITTNTAGVWNEKYIIGNCGATGTPTWILQDTRSSGWDAVQTKDVMLIDLTAWFNPTIADYIYSVEQATEGAGVELVKKWAGIKGYIPYDAGSLKSVSNVSEHKMVGFNQWDEQWEEGNIDSTTGQNTSVTGRIRSKNYIPVLEGARYYFKGSDSIGLRYYDVNKNFISYDTVMNQTRVIPNGVAYLRFICLNTTTYNNDICINLSSEKNGQYEPYKTRSYTLDSSLTLRGITKLVNNELVYDGDIYPPSGEVQRNWAERAYQNGDTSNGTTMITDGTRTVYKLNSPTTETADPYAPLQTIYDGGTEEYVTDSIPVGHNTKVHEDLKKKIEGIPPLPTANGSYHLKATVSNGTVTYTWSTT